MSLALAMKHCSHVTTAHAESFLHDQDPLLTSLADAFKTAFERLSGSDVFGLMPDPPFFTFARLSVVAVFWLS